MIIQNSVFKVSFLALALVHAVGFAQASPDCSKMLQALDRLAQEGLDLTCREPGKGGFRINLKEGLFTHVQSGMLWGEKLHYIHVYQIEELLGGEGFRVRGEFFAGDFIGIELRVRRVGDQWVAEESGKSSSGESWEKENIPCLESEGNTAKARKLKARAKKRAMSTLGRIF